MNALVIVDGNTASHHPTRLHSNFYERAYAGKTDLPVREFADCEAVMNFFSISHLTPDYHPSRLRVTHRGAAIGSPPPFGSPDSLAAFHAWIDRFQGRVIEWLRAGELQADTPITWGRDDTSAPDRTYRQRAGIPLVRKPYQTAHLQQVLPPQLP